MDFLLGVYLQIESDDESASDGDSCIVSETTVNEPTTSGAGRKRRSAADSNSDQLEVKSGRLVGAATKDLNDGGSGVANGYSAHEDNDDWLFAQRLFLRLRKFPDDLRKERLKVNLDMEVLNAMELSESN